MSITVTIERSFERGVKKDFENIVEAVRDASSYEADLYYEGKLIFSPLSLSDDDNIESLRKYGIERYEGNNKSYKYRFIDPKLRTELIYVEYSEHCLFEIDQIDVRIHDYKSESYCKCFESLETFKADLELNIYSKYDEIDVCIGDFRDGYIPLDRNLKERMSLSDVDRSSIEYKYIKELVLVNERTKDEVTQSLMHLDTSQNYIAFRDGKSIRDFLYIPQNDKGYFNIGVNKFSFKLNDCK